MWDKNRLVVICIDTGELFQSAAEVEEKMGIGHSDISKVCRGKQHSAGKDQNGNSLHWKYADENLARQYQPKQNFNKTKIYNDETKEVFESCLEACKKYNVSASTLSRHLSENTQFCWNREKHKNINLKDIKKVIKWLDINLIIKYLMKRNINK